MNKKIIKIKNKKNSGFTALMTAIIISAILLLIATSLSFTGFYNRSDILDSELKEKSSAMAEACADKAILNISQNINFTGDVSVGSDKCTIQSVSGGSQKTILIEANYKNYFTDLKIIINSADLSILSWQEI